MDVELARTFLAVVDTGSFLSAADRVHVTQSTVSARIKSLEDQLRRQLFTRGRFGAELTPAGRHFYRHAQSIHRSWAQARIDVGLPEGIETAIEIGAQYSLWDGYLTRAIGALHRRFGDFAFRASMGNPETLIQELVEGALDIAVVYRPEARPGFVMQRLFDDEFVLATSNPDPGADPLGAEYVFVDWGPDFRADHAREFPTLTTPALQFRVGTLGLQHLQANPASGYFPSRLLKNAGTGLRLIEEVPRFSYSAFAVYLDDAEDDTYKSVVQELKALSDGIEPSQTGRPPERPTRV